MSVSLWINLSGIVISKVCHQIEWSEKVSAIFIHPGFYGDEINKDTKFKYDTFNWVNPRNNRIYKYNYWATIIDSLRKVYFAMNNSRVI
jgi:hypothetical protein